MHVRILVGLPMGTNCPPLVAGLFLFCYKRNFMASLSDETQAEIIQTLIYFKRICVIRNL